MVDSQRRFWLDEIFGKDREQIGFDSTAGIIIPSGTTAQRPTAPVVGHIRVNTDTNEVEAFSGGVWSKVSVGESFIGLPDTPATYVGQAGKIPRIDNAETAVIFSPITILNSGAINVSGVLDYENLVTTDDIIPNRKYVQDQDALRLALTGGTMTGTIDFFSGTITGLTATPTFPSEATSKAYVDSIIGGTAFTSIEVSGQSTVVSDSGSDTLTLVAGTNMTITTDAGTDTITINASGGGSSDSITDADADTSIQVEESADEDIIRFDVGDSPAGFGAVTDIVTIASSGIAVDLGTATGSVGAPISITAGSAAVGSNANGGDIELRPGALDGTGANGSVSIIGPTNTPGIIELQDSFDGEFLRFTVPATITTSYTLTWPAADGTSGQVLVTDGAGILSFIDQTDSDAFSSIAVSGQSTVVADSPTDTLTLVAGTNITITTDAGTDTITLNASSGDAFTNIAVSGETTVVADSGTDTLTLVAGTNVTITTDDTTDTITFESVDNDSVTLSSNSIDAVTTWTSRAAVAGTSWHGITWSPELNLFAAVSTTGLVMTSPDGITWTSRTSPGNNWRSIIWSSELGLFVVVSFIAPNQIITSPDGITWTIRTAAEANAWTSVTWSPELGLFAAVSEDGTNQVMTSPDGITWTARLAAEANVWRGITWSPELSLFAAVAASGTNRVMTSPDGINWSPQLAAEANAWRAITWSPELGLFAAVSQTGTNRVMTSPDGITWSPQLAAEANGWYYIAWSPGLGLFAAVSQDGTSRVMTSPDGITWTSRTAAEANDWRSITWSPELGLFASVSTSGTNQVMTSKAYNAYPQYRLVKDDRANLPAAETIADVSVETWNARTAAEANAWRYVAWSPELGIFAAVSSNGTNQVMTSPDGINWTARTAAEANGWEDIAWSPELGLFAAVAQTGTNRVMTSPDGITWTARVTTASPWKTLTWSSELGLFAAVAGSLVMTSPDGITWTDTPSAEANSWQSIAWSPELGLFVAVANGGTNRVMTSPDGINWTARTAAEANQWRGVTWSPELGLFVAVSGSTGTNLVMTSPDGITWIGRTAAEANEWQSITWSSELGILIAVSGNGTNRIMTSPDGITWTSRLAAEAIAWENITWSPELGLFVAVAANGANPVMTSTVYNPSSKYRLIEDDKTYFLSTTTTDATATVMDVDGKTGTRLTLPIDSATGFRVMVVGREPATGDSYYESLEGLIKRTASTTSLVGSVASIITNDAGAAAWDVDVIANDTLDTIDIQVTGEAAKTINWSARIMIEQVID